MLTKLKFLFDFIIRGGPADGLKLISGVLVYFLPGWLGIPLDFQVEDGVTFATLLQQTAQLIIMWGLLGKAYKKGVGE